MKQVLQCLRTGRTSVEEVPSCGPSAGGVLIQTRASLISPGTERTLVEFGKAGLVGKFRSQPDKVKQVIDKIKADGLIPTLEAISRKLDQPLALGYCNAGVVLEVGPGVTEFRPGDRVVSNGPHAEEVCVPRNLCAKIPEGISDEQAAFAVISAIGLQGIRLLAPAFGEKVVVYGLGLIGLLCVQMLRASGCDVLGVDINPRRLKLAGRYGAKAVDAGQGDPVVAADAWTEGRGADAVLIAASAKTDQIVHFSAQMCRKRGRIVLVGVTGMNLRRSDFYQKELTFQVSCSYGPGRYDSKYEQLGQDYPYGLVRWTEQRNFQAVLAAMASGALRVDDLITHRFPIIEAGRAYRKISEDPSALGVILVYPSQPKRSRSVNLASVPVEAAGRVKVGVIGAGNFAAGVLMPALSRTAARIAYVADLVPAAAGHLARKYGAARATTEYARILDDGEVKAVLIATGHDSHARLVCEALEAGKHVLVEKPLALNRQELDRVAAAAAARPDRLLMVGFNRRFSPHVVKINELLAGRSGPLCMNVTINAGAVPPDHWVHDPVRGGGRIIGEACHFVDLLSFIASSGVKTVAACMVGRAEGVQEDKMSVALAFEDGSIGTINYFANGSKSYPKEMLEVFSDARVLRLENFRRLTGYGFAGFRKFRTFRQDKGHTAELRTFVERAASGGEQIIPLDSLVNVTLASFAAVKAAAEARTIVLAEEHAVSQAG